MIGVASSDISEAEFHTSYYEMLLLMKAPRDMIINKAVIKKVRLTVNSVHFDSERSGGLEVECKTRYYPEEKPVDHSLSFYMELRNKKLIELGDEVKH